jgi:polyisoprenoid-binding protein YceI
MSTTIEQTAVPTGTWNADTVHSGLGFEVPYAVAAFSGEVTDFDVSLTDGTLRGAARIASLRLKEENLTAHLLSPEFFDAERFPDLTFVSSEIRRDGDDVEIDGEVTLKGITRPATLTGTITGPTVDHFGATRVGFRLETVIDRTEFDIKWNTQLPNGEPALGNEVALKADLTLVQA